MNKPHWKARTLVGAAICGGCWKDWPCPGAACPQFCKCCGPSQEHQDKLDELAEQGIGVVTVKDKIRFDSEIFVELIKHSANDAMVVHAARISTGNDVDASDDKPLEKADIGLINFLMKNRHGTPFEHGSFTFRVRVPIFVMRELHRHRIGFSYNEESGRYKQLDPHFYVPATFRPLVQEGKPGHYNYVTGSQDMVATTKRVIERASTDSWYEYEMLLKAGIAKEVARMVLPVNIYSSCYVTCNPRSLMNFLSLRTKGEQAMFPSFPMYEIEQMANKMELQFKYSMPATHKAYVDNRRVAP